MLKTIAQPAPELASFIEALNLPLSRPQQRHVTQIADSLVTTEGNKTLSAMYRHIVGDPCSKSAADTFREAPWRADDLRISLREFLVQTAFTSAEAEAAPKRVFLSLDDSLIYLLCDSWYAAASLIKWCRAQDWHVICRLKSNRLLSGVQVRHHDPRLMHRRYTRVRVPAADEEPPRYYLVRSLTGKLSTLPATVRVFISRRHNRDRRPRYCSSTDPSLSAHQALTWFHKRWSCEVANWYITERLGWADCRLWRVESVEKYMMVLWLALTFLEYRQASAPEHKNPADVIRAHRQEHAVRVLKEACSMVLQFGSVPAVLARFTFAPAPI